MALLFLTGNYQVIGRVVQVFNLKSWPILCTLRFVYKKSMNVTTEELSSKNPLLLATCELALGIVTSQYLIYHPHMSLSNVDW